MEALLISSSVLILFVILLRAVFGKHISFRMRYALWLIVALRLALPFALPDSPVSVMNYVPFIQAFFGWEADFDGYAGVGEVGSLLIGESGNAEGLSGGTIGVYGSMPTGEIGSFAGLLAGMPETYGSMLAEAFGLLSAEAAKEPVILPVRQGDSDVRFYDESQGVLPLGEAALLQGAQQQGAWGQQDASQPQSRLQPQAAAPMRKAVMEKLQRGFYAVWLTGAALMSLYLFTVNMILYQKLRRTRVLICPDGQTDDGRTLPVYLCKNLASPCLFGIWRPAVYLNEKAAADENDRLYALAHERQHYRHKDHVWSLVRLLCLTVYWFHPLVWAAAALSAEDCELACDEGVTARITEEECTAYGHSLIRQVALKRGGMRLTASTSMSSSARALKRRLLAITQKKKNSVWAALLAGALLVLITGCTFTGADDQSPATESGAEGSTGENGTNGAATGENGTDEAAAGENGTNGAAAGNNGTDETTEKISSDRERISRLEESIRIDRDGYLAFTIPESDHVPEDWSISIQGKAYTGDGTVVMSYGGGECPWESGETYTIMKADDVLSDLSELSMDITLRTFSDDDEQILTGARIDLVECSRELLGSAAGETAVQTALRAYTMFSDKRHGWALTEDDQVLYTHDGAGGFSLLYILPTAEAGEVVGGFERFLEGSQVASCFLDEKTAYFAGFSADLRGALFIRESITEEPDAGNENGCALTAQHRTRIPLKEYFPQGTIYMSFADARNGYLLVCSDPALGLMTKHLYRTVDGGDSFSFVADVSGAITGYPTGIAFCGEEVGYIGTTYHGEDNYLYGTRDGGETWESLTLPVHATAAYVDGLAPVLYGEDRTQAAVVLRNGGENSQYVLYRNNRAAEDLNTWELIRILPYEDIRSYSFTDADTGYFIDGDGKLHEWSGK